MALSRAQWAGSPSIKGSSEPVRYMLLTAAILGLQFTWGIEMTYLTPVLLQLGLSKSKLALVWLAGPLSGLVVQPVVGILADKSTSKYGRRRPVMIAGSFVVASLLIILGWAAEIVSVFTKNEERIREATIVLAVLAIYALDFAINAVQSSCRSLIVDTLPVGKQQLGSAWASRMAGVGHLIGYAIGAMDLGKVFGDTLGDTQFKQLTLISALALLIAVGITSWAVKERVLISSGGRAGGQGIFATLSTIVHLAMDLPPQMAAICYIQCWAWIAWFPFLFYSSTWVGETWLRHDAPPEVRENADRMAEIGRVGSSTLILFSVVTFICSISLPWLVRSPDAKPRKMTPFTPRPPELIKRILPFLPDERPSLLTAWMLGHFMLACTLIWAPVVTTLKGATVVVSLSGVPWSLACWAPFAFMGVEINRLGASGPPQRQGPDSESLVLNVLHHSPIPSHKPTLSTDLDFINREPDGTILHLRQDSRPATPTHPDDLKREEDSAGGQTGELAGIYLGILNLYTVFPQFIATGISTIVFAILEPGQSKELADSTDGSAKKTTHEGLSGIAVCLFIGALSSAVAGWRTWRFSKTYV